MNGTRETHCRTSRAYILRARECQRALPRGIHPARLVGCEAELAADRSWRNKRLTRREATSVRPRAGDLAAVPLRGEPVPRLADVVLSEFDEGDFGRGGELLREREFRLRCCVLTCFVLRLIRTRVLLLAEPRSPRRSHFHSLRQFFLARPLARTIHPARCGDDSTTPETPCTETEPLASQKLAAHRLIKPVHHATIPPSLACVARRRSNCSSAPSSLPACERRRTFEQGAGDEEETRHRTLRFVANLLRALPPSHL